MAGKRKLGARIYTFFLVLYGLLIIVAACYGLLMVWTYAEEYEYTRPHHALDSYMEMINRDRWDDAMAEAVAAMPHETQSDEEIKAFIQDKLSSGITAVRKGGGADTSVYSLRCNGREIGTVTINEDTSYRSRIDTTQKPWSLLQWRLYPWKVAGETFDFNALYNSVEVTVPSDYQVFVNGVRLGEEYIVERNIPFDNYQKIYYQFRSSLPTKVRYRFDHVIGEAKTEIRDADGNPVTIDPDRNDSQFTHYATGEEFARFEEFVIPFAASYLRYISGVGDSGLQLADLRNYMYPGGELWNRMHDALDGLGWAHTTSINVDSVVVNSVLPLSDGFTEVDMSTTASIYYYGKGNLTSDSNMRVLVYDDGERLYVESLELY